MKTCISITVLALILGSCIQAPKEESLANYIPPNFSSNLSWKTESTGMGDLAIKGFAWNGSTYIAVGEGIIASSSDGKKWKENTAEKNNWNTGTDHIYFNSVVWGNNQFVAVGYWVKRTVSMGVIAVSNSNGENWNIVLAPVLTADISNGTLKVDPKLYGITYGGGRYVAVGERGWSAWSIDPDDTDKWNEVWITPFSEYGMEQVNQNATAIAYGNGRFVVGGTMGKLAYSPNGIAWTWIANGILDGEFSHILALGYEGGRFIVAGSGGSIKIYEGGEMENISSWSTVNSGITTDITAVTYGNGYYLAVGGGGKIAVSRNTYSWVVVPHKGWDNSDNMHCAIFGDRFIIGGQAGESGQSKIIYSE